MLLLETDGNPTPAAVTDLLALTNADRMALGLSPLGASRALSLAAQMKADDMADRGYFAHETPDGLSPWYWMTKAGYSYRAAGENLAVYFTDTRSVEKAWMASPEHRANLLDRQYADVGYGITHGTYHGYDAIFVVQMFGKPATSAVAHPKPLSRVLPSSLSSPVATSTRQVALVKGAAIPVHTVDQLPLHAFSGPLLLIGISCCVCLVLLYTQYMSRDTICT